MSDDPKTPPRAVLGSPADYLGWKDLPDGRCAFVVPLLHHHAMLLVGPREELWADDGW